MPPADLAQVNDKYLEKIATNSDIINELHREAALQVIDRYLESNPKEENKEFFNYLKKEILKKKGAIYTELHQALSHFKTKFSKEFQFPSLFTQWFGPAQYSDASLCLQQLYFLATDKKLTEKEVTAMITEGDLPQNTGQDAYDKAHIHRVLTNPIKYRNTVFKQSVLTEYLKLKQADEDVALEAQIARATAQSRAEAAYQQKILDNASMLVEKISTNGELCFDTQGQVMVEVPPLNEAELLKISGDDTEILKALNVDLTKGTLCSVDTHFLPRDQFLLWVTNAVTQHNRILSVAQFKAIQDLINGESLSSIIPLQKEMTLHIMLAMRVFQTKIGGTEQDSAIWQHILKDTLNKINHNLKNEHNEGISLRDKYAEALYSSFESTPNTIPDGLPNTTINIERLNAALDTARGELAPQCRKLLIEACYKWLPQRNQLKEALANLTDKDFETTPASDKDYLRSDASNGIVTRVTRTTKTAHGKAYGAEEQAFRLVHISRYTREGLVEALDRRLHCVARVPSVAQLTVDNRKPLGIIGFLKKIFKALTHKESVDDVTEKLEVSYQKLQAQLGGNYNGPMTYNLLTSLHSKFYDFFVDSKNAQRASAARILKGAHKFNAEQIKPGKPNRLWYVQNIPVNQHTDNLSYTADDSATREATLMTDIALLSTFSQHAELFGTNLSEQLRKDYFEIHQTYQLFLIGNVQGDIYFHETPIAALVMNKLECLKQKIATEKPVPLQQGSGNLDKPKDSENMVTLAIRALSKLYAHNMHWNKQYGMLIQALSVFVERACQVGCKSAAERLESVLGRVLLLESMNANLKSQDNNPMLKALQQFVTAEGNVEDLQEKLDTCYSKRTLYMQEFSSNDSGGPSKVKASTSGTGRVKEWWNTNIAESSFVTFLKQKWADSMQSHKMKPAKTFQKLSAEIAEKFEGIDPEPLPIAIPSRQQSMDQRLSPPPSPVLYGELFPDPKKEEHQNNHRPSPSEDSPSSEKKMDVTP